MGLFDIFSGKKVEDECAIALDIGTEFAKSLIFRVEDGKGYVIGAGRQRQRLSDMQGGAVTDIHGVVQNCQKSLERAAEQAGVMPTQWLWGSRVSS